MDFLLTKTFLIEVCITTLGFYKFPVSTFVFFGGITALSLYKNSLKKFPKNTIPKSMKAALYDVKQHFKIKDIAVPKFSEDELLIRVKAAAINPIDYKIITVKIPFYRWLVQPTVGRDFSGCVIDIGSNVSKFKIGDEVYGNAIGGSIQEYTVVNKNQIGHKPSNMTFPEAASIGLAAATSLQALNNWGELNNKNVLIIGASGGTGSFGVQLAKYYNNKVYGVCGPKNVDYVKSLGADVIVDYSKYESFDSLENVEFDLIYDTVTSQEDQDQRMIYGKFLKKDGKYVQINAKGSDWSRSIFRKLTGINLEKSNFHVTLLDWNNEDLEILRKIAAEGKLTTKIQIFNFDKKDVNTAFEQLKSRRTVGKIVIEI